LNFLTIHDRSRFPGLFVWTREGKRLAVKVPPGCVLVQAGKQAEWLTGGHILAGFHEVIVSAATVKTIEARKAENKSLWRVSSTLFSHIQSDQVLQPVGKFASDETIKAFPAMKAGDMVQAELAHINLAKTAGDE
jgi:isopenicillin N synthase-like dioxygenase